MWSCEQNLEPRRTFVKTYGVCFPSVMCMIEVVRRMVEILSIVFGMHVGK